MMRYARDVEGDSCLFAGKGAKDRPTQVDAEHASEGPGKTCPHAVGDR